MKPKKCIYILVNAVGVNTPSHIDLENNLFKTCKAGDGVVCSNIIGVENNKNNTTPKKINSLFKYFKFKNVNRKSKNSTYDSTEPTTTSSSSSSVSGGGDCNNDTSSSQIENSINNMYKNITNQNQPSDDYQFTNVHITMLNNIDIFKPLQNILTTSKHMMWKKMYSFNTIVDGDDNIKIINEFQKDYDGYLIDIKNTDSNQCLFSIKDTNLIQTEKIILITLNMISFNKENKIIKNNNRNSNLNIKINTRCDGSIFNKLQFIITGHYFISNVAFLKGDVSNVDGINDCRITGCSNIRDGYNNDMKTYDSDDSSDMDKVSLA